MRNYDSVGIQIPDILLPREGVDLKKWAVVACDQFTAEREYWKNVEEFVGDAPSTLHLIFPEVYLDDPGKDQRIQKIQSKMVEYLQSGIFVSHEGAIYVERTAGDHSRKGLVLCMDLEKYDHRKGSETLIRATEGTILERLPPRIKIREGAPLELPHIMVLIDDPQRTVIEPIGEAKDSLEKLYDFETMNDSGRLQGYKVTLNLEKGMVHALKNLSRPEVFKQKYGFKEDRKVLLYAMGDGNHSLATAKECWERLKREKGKDHPTRYALVELVNVHDEALQFEPIHRLLFNLKRDPIAEMAKFYRENFAYKKCEDQDQMIAAVENAPPHKHVIGIVSDGRFSAVEITNPTANLPVGTLQPFLDLFVKESGTKIEYVHGRDVLVNLGLKEHNLGFYLPAMDKSDLFKTVILDGVLPRKTFSMGEAKEKRFYMECRKIVS